MARNTTTDTAETTEKVTRPRKSPAEKAQQQYDKASAQLNRAQDRLAKLQAQLNEAQAEVVRAERQLDYTSRNPDLPAAPEVEGTNASE